MPRDKNAAFHVYAVCSVKQGKTPSKQAWPGAGTRGDPQAAAGDVPGWALPAAIGTLSAKAGSKSLRNTEPKEWLPLRYDIFSVSYLSASLAYTELRQTDAFSNLLSHAVHPSHKI